MAKLEEIAELLTDEIEGFNQSIKKLEGVSNKINNVKFSSDISNIKYLLEEQKREIKHQLNRQNGQLDQISNKLNKVRIFPNWLVVLFFVFVIIYALVIAFLIYRLINILS